MNFEVKINSMAIGYWFGINTPAPSLSRLSFIFLTPRPPLLAA
jgi:hypothetical protein